MVLTQADLGCQATLSRTMALRVVIILRITPESSTTRTLSAIVFYSDSFLFEKPRGDLIEGE